MAIIVVGDIHFRDQEPYYSAGLRFIDWFRDQEFNNESNSLIQLGDVTHNSLLNGRVVRLFMNHFFNELKFAHTYVIQGNHDVDNRSKTSVLEPLKDVPNIDIIDEPQLLTVEGQEFLCLPHLLTDMKKAYSNVYETLGIEGKEDRIVLGHLADETQTLFGKFTDLSYLVEKTRLLGHVHRFSGNYIGTPFKQRYDERDEVNRIVSVEGGKITPIEVPDMLGFVQVKYGSPVEYKCKIPYLTVVDAPSVDMAFDMYSTFNIRKVVLASNESGEGSSFEEEEGEEKTLMSYFNDFSKDRKLNEFESTKISEKLSKVV